MKSMYSLPAAAVGAALVLGACSSSAGYSAGGSAAGGGSSSKTVAVRHVAGASVLVDSAGRTLYVSDQEKRLGKVLCASNDCTAVWIPLTVPKGQQLSAPASVARQLTVVARPDGTRQVTLGGTPLYSFAFDHASGDVTGDGQHDSFDGTNFSWHAATASGAVTTPSTSGPSYSYGTY